MSRRVVVTGIGLVSSVGIGTEANWIALLAGRSGIAPITHFDVSQFATQHRGRSEGVRSAGVHREEGRQEDGRLHPVRDGGVAVRDGRLGPRPSRRPTRTAIGVFIASGIGGFGTIEREHKAYLDGGPRRISPFFIPSAIINLASGQVSIRFGAKGPNTATCTACSASAHAIGDAFEIIRRGAADVMIAGGSEAAITPMGVGGFGAMRALSTRNDAPQRASRPFDKDRDGFVIGEGSGVVILEELEHAQARGARIYAEVVGYGMSSDAYHMTGQPEDRRRRGPVDAGRARARPASRPTSCSTSTRTARRRPSTIPTRRSPSSNASASTPTSWRCRRPSR